MNINRDNYEEYFLLYADNELTDSEKAEVLMFVKNNKDLEEEFRMIHRTISRPDADLKLTDKSFLLRNTSSFINEKNYEEVFVLYHDGELSANEMQQTEAFVAAHKDLQKEFELIKIARLVPEKIIFTNKNILYKKEKGRVIPVMWRMLAAAVFIGFIAAGIYLYLQKTKTNNEQMAHAVPAKHLPANNNQSLPVKKTNEDVAHTTVAPQQKEKKENQLSVKKHSLQKNNSFMVKNIEKANNKFKEELNIQQPLPKENEETTALNTGVKNIAGTDIHSSENTSLAKLSAPGDAIENIVNTQAVPNVRTASYNENAVKNDNYVFYDVTTDEFRKTKVGGFLKKFKRVIVRSNPIGRLLSGDERQVASN